MSERTLRLYCDDIWDSGNAILDFAQSMTFEEFCKRSLIPFYKT